MTLLGNVISTFKNACLKEVEDFEDHGKKEQRKEVREGEEGEEVNRNEKNKCWTNFVASFLNWLVVTFITLFIGKFLWNNYLVPAVATFNPVKGIVQMFAIVILFQLFTA